MKRESPDYRRMALPALFVRPCADNEQNSAPCFSVTRQQRGRSSKIFVIKKTIGLLPTNGRHKKIRRILIFDNHPDSLRLVYGHRLHPGIDLSPPQRVSLWELIVVSVVTIAGLVGMFWPFL